MEVYLSWEQIQEARDRINAHHFTTDSNPQSFVGGVIAKICWLFVNPFTNVTKLWPTEEELKKRNEGLVKKIVARIHMKNLDN